MGRRFSPLDFSYSHFSPHFKIGKYLVLPWKRIKKINICLFLNISIYKKIWKISWEEKH